MFEERRSRQSSCGVGELSATGAVFRTVRGKATQIALSLVK
jgi:hypothetical protein